MKFSLKQTADAYQSSLTKPSLLLRNSLPIICVLLFFLVVISPLPLSAQTPVAAPETAATTENIPVSEISPSIEKTKALYADVETLEVQTDIVAAPSRIADFARGHATLLSEQAGVLRDLSLEKLRLLETRWQKLQGEIDDSADKTNAVAALVDSAITSLKTQEKIWKNTLKDVPPEIVAQVKTTLTLIEHGLVKAIKLQVYAISLQTQFQDLQSKVGEALAQNAGAKQRIVNNLAVKDSAPLWDASAWNFTSALKIQTSFLNQALNQAGEQATAFLAFIIRNLQTILIHFALIFLVSNLLFKLTRQQTISVGTPLLLSVLIEPFVYAEPSKLWALILGLLALLPLSAILKKDSTKEGTQAFGLLTFLYFIDVGRVLFLPNALLSRLCFLSEVFVGAVFFTAMSLPQSKLSKRLLAGLFFLAFIATSSGYVQFGMFLGSLLLRALFVGSIIWALVLVLERLTAILLTHSRYSELRLVKANHETLATSLRTAFRVGGVALWAYLVISEFSFGDEIFTGFSRLLRASVHLGSLSFSLGGLALLIAGIWITILISRVSRFILEEEVYSRFNLGRGVPYTISTLLHYSILVIGFLITAAAVGFDLTKFTLLAGAIGVGLGFGLQNIINNFVSGIILLIERPVKVGDVVQLGPDQGTVERIGIRASVIRTTVGSKLIVPNSRFISDQVINWTFSAAQREIDIQLTVGSSKPPEEIMSMLEQVALKSGLVVPVPAPRAVLVKLGPDNFSLELQTWTDQFDEWVKFAASSIG